MSNIIGSSEFQNLVTNKILNVMEEEEKYGELASMIPTLYNVMSSNNAFEEYFETGSVPDIPQSTGKVTYLKVSPGYSTKIEPKEFLGGLQYNRKFLDDKRYNVMNRDAKGLMRSANRVKEKYGARTFQNAFSSAFDFMQSEEGVSLCSSSHLTKAGVSTASGFDNTGTLALNKTNVAATRVAMGQFRSSIGERIDVGNNLALIVPDNLADAASEIVNTISGLDANEGNANPHYKRYDIIVYKRLDDTDSNNWFMVDQDQMKEDLLWLDRISPEKNANIDFQTKATQVSVYFRIAAGFKDWRWCFGHNVS